MLRPFVLLLALLAIPAITMSPVSDASALDARVDGLVAGVEEPATGLAERAAGTDPQTSGALPFHYDLYSFRGDDGKTAVVASFAVRVGDLERERIERDSRYRFNVTLVVADTVEQQVYRADDSVHVRVPGRLNRNHFLFTQVEIQAPPSTTTKQRVVMIDAPRAGVGELYTHPYTVPDYTGSHLMLSDIAVGLPDAPGGWRRRGETLALLPGSHFPGGSFEVYYEIYNLPDGHDFITDIAVEPVGAGSVGQEGDDGADRADEERATRVRFHSESSVGPDGVTAELRHVIATMAAGQHRLTVTVTDQETGESASRSRLLDVRPWRDGATLVSTCPVAAGAVRPGCG